MKNNLKEIRKKQGKTQFDLAVLTGIPQDKISQIENSKTMPGIERALSLASGLGVAVEDIWQLEVSR